MKLKSKLLAGAFAASLISLSTSAQLSLPAIHDGSNGSRAPLPSNRPTDYETASANESTPAPGFLVARHAGESPSNQLVAGTTPVLTPSISLATITPAEPALTPTGRSILAAGASLNATQMGPQIRSVTMSSRGQLVTDLEQRMTVSDQAMVAIWKTVPDMSAQGSAEFKLAAGDVRVKEKAVRKSIHSPRSTNREQLASDYEAYAAAVDRVDVAVGSVPAKY